MKFKIGFAWLAFYVSIGISFYLGVTFSSYILIIPVTIFLLLMQIFFMPTCTYNKGCGWINKPIIMTYSAKDICQQFIFDFIITTIIYFSAYWLTKLFIHS